MNWTFTSVHIIYFIPDENITLVLSAISNVFHALIPPSLSNWHSSGQKMTLPLRNPKFHDRVHDISPRSQINAYIYIYIYIYNFFKLIFNIMPPIHISFPRYSLTLDVQCISYFNVRGSCLVQSIIPARMNLRMFTLKYKSWRFTFSSFFSSSCHLHSRSPKNFPQHFDFNSLKFCSSSRPTDHTASLYSTKDKTVVSYKLLLADTGGRAV
jgi:hypothetical protein